MGPSLRRRGARLVRWAREPATGGRALAAATFGLSLAFQVAYFLSYRGGVSPYAPDSDLYTKLAQALVQGEGYAVNREPTAVVPPLYSLMLAPFYAAGVDDPLVFSAIGLLLGALTATLIAFLARRVYGETEGWVAGAIAALLPPIAVWSPYVLSDTLALALLAGAALALADPAGPRPRAAALGGALLGAAILTRPAMAFPAAALLAWLALRRAPGRRLLTTAAAVGATALVLLPWAVRNEVEVGRPYVLSSYGGANLWVAVHWRPNGKGTPGRDVPALPYLPVGTSEPGQDDHQRDRALDVLREDPGPYLRGLYQKPLVMWPLTPPDRLRELGESRLSARSLGEVWLTLLALLALAGYAMRPEVRRGGAWWLWITAGLTASVVLLYIDALLRYRLPAVVAVVPPAAAALVAFARRPPSVRRRGGAGRPPSPRRTG